MSELFRAEAIEAKRERLEGAVIAATPPSARVYALFLGGAFLMLVALLVFGSFSARETVRGTVAFDRGITRIYPPAPAELRRVAVRDGQAVDEGQVLAVVAVTPGRDAGGDGVAGQLRETLRQSMELERQQLIAERQAVAEMAAQQRQRASLEAAIATLERQSALAEQQIRLAQSDRDRAGRLLAEKAGTQRQLEEARAQVLARQADRESIGLQLIEQREALRRLADGLDRAQLEGARAVSELSARRADLAERRAALARLDRLELVAPISGRVTDLSAQTGQRIGPDSSLLTIIPDGARSEIWLYAPSRAAGRVSIGQEVRLLFDAFPFSKFGAGRGTVIAVSDVPTDAARLDPGLGLTEPVYRVRVRLDRMVEGDGGTPLALRQGMTLSANLVLERRALWEVFFAPVLRAIRG